MSFFGVTKEHIREVKPHPNADRLELANLEGLDFQFVVGKGQWKSGDECLYFPLDSIVPPELQKKLGVEGKLAGKNRDRISTVRLRGEVSMGMVGPLSLLDGLDDSKSITEALGVTKYDPPEVIQSDATLLPLPIGVPTYDIESALRYPDVLKELSGVRTAILEKLEGTNYSITNRGDNVWVNQRNYSIQEKPDSSHFFWDVTRRMELVGKVRLARRMSSASQITLRGELVGPGIKKNIYGLKSCIVYFFDVLRDGKYLDFLDCKDLLTRLKLNIVPIICTTDTGPHHSTVQELSVGFSAIGNTMREGIVIKPMKEMRHEKIGRLILKCHNPEYLLRSSR